MLCQGRPSPELSEQLVLIKDLAPYYRHLRDDDVAIFFERLFDFWFTHWRLKRQDYGGNDVLLKDGMKRKMKRMLAQGLLEGLCAAGGFGACCWGGISKHM
ncbi:hypothetical protein BJ912DRAFT_937123 [Pholiota molesta]|nr:hypothetical protein BJ912DRAFT_937123 [Pholiota molesta]